MADTREIKCYVKVNTNNLNGLINKTLKFMGETATINDKGEAVFECKVNDEDRCKSFPITIESDDYIVLGTGKCNIAAHTNENNPFYLTLNLNNTANMQSIRIYKKEQIEENNQTKEIEKDIFTTQITNNTQSNQSSNDSSNTKEVNRESNQYNQTQDEVQEVFLETKFVVGNHNGGKIPNVK